MYQENTCIICFKQNEERLITVTSNGCSTLKTYCHKRKCSSLLKLIEECKSNKGHKLKVGSSLLFFIFNNLLYVPTENLSMLRTHAKCVTTILSLKNTPILYISIVFQIIYRPLKSWKCLIYCGNKDKVRQ